MRKTGLRKTAGGTPPGIAAAAAALVLAFALTATGCREEADGGIPGETPTLRGQTRLSDDRGGNSAAAERGFSLADPNRLKRILRERDETGIAAVPIRPPPPPEVAAPADASPAAPPPVAVGVFGPSLNLSGQVWMRAAWGQPPEYFTESRELIAFPSGGTGGISEGQLNFSIGRPAAEELAGIMELVTELEDFGWEQVSASPAAARFAWLGLETHAGMLGREDETETETATVRSISETYVLYVYVDQDVTISSAGWSKSGGEPGWSRLETAEAFSVTLREGWNALYFLYEEVETDTSEVARFALAHAAPAHVRWMLFEW